MPAGSVRPPNPLSCGAGSYSLGGRGAPGPPSAGAPLDGARFKHRRQLPISLRVRRQGWELGHGLQTIGRRASIRARVVIAAGALALASLGALGYVQLTTTSDSLSGAAQDQTQTLAVQLASALVGSGQAVANVIPFTPRGLDGVMMLDEHAKVTASAGSLAPALRQLRPQALAAARSGHQEFEFRVPRARGASERIGRLTAWSPDSTIAVALVPQQGGGVLVAGVHANWAVEKLRTTAYSTALSLGGGVLFIAFGLMLLLGRLVTAPVARLAAEVRNFGEGQLDRALSNQRTPELQQLAADISQMREDLLAAVAEAGTDPLTGVANHRAFQDRLAGLVEHSTSTREPLALIAVDLDKLKEINDRFGHVAGDRVISAVVSRIAGCCSDSQLCARVGGDEFAILCPGSTRAEAESLAARMREAVGALPAESLFGASDMRISISAGVGDMPGGATTREALLHQADTDLYRMKGRRDGTTPREAAVSAPPAPSDTSHIVRALAVAVDARDSGTYSHCETVAQYATAIAKQLGLADADVPPIERAALLHDVGKIGVPDAILRKPARLTEEEFDVMRAHSTLGYRILLNGGLPPAEALWVLHHHEHVNGSGYPHGLRGDEIPLQSRILLVADAFEAMTADRPYRSGRPADAALDELRRCAGTQFDSAVVDAFVSVLATPQGGSALPQALFDRLLAQETQA